MTPRVCTPALTATVWANSQIKLSVGATSVHDLLEIEDRLTQGSRRSRTVGEPVG